MKRTYELHLGETLSTGPFNGVKVSWGASITFDDEEIGAMGLKPSIIKENFVNEVKSDFLKRRAEKLQEHLEFRRKHE